MQHGDRHHPSDLSLGAWWAPDGKKCNRFRFHCSLAVLAVTLSRHASGIALRLRERTKTGKSRIPKKFCIGAFLPPVIPFRMIPFRLLPFRVMPFCVMPFRVMPFCVMLFVWCLSTRCLQLNAFLRDAISRDTFHRVMPFRVMRFSAMPFRMMPFSLMPFSVWYL